MSCDLHEETSDFIHNILKQEWIFKKECTVILIHVM